VFRRVVTLLNKQKHCDKYYDSKKNHIRGRNPIRWRSAVEQLQSKETTIANQQNNNRKGHSKNTTYNSCDSKDNITKSRGGEGPLTTAATAPFREQGWW